MELLASRIMTPYFGVSLYIWSGILSITYDGRHSHTLTKEQRWSPR